MENHDFQGFETGAFTFLEELAANNNRDWFLENRERYEREVLEPAGSFVEALGSMLRKRLPSVNYDTRRNGSGSIMRIYRDIRFSKDKRPYKENLGLVFWMGSGKKVERPGFYFHMDTRDIFFYGGQHVFPKDTLERYRAAAADDRRGGELQRIITECGRAGLPVMEEPAYKRVPRGYPQDHPRAELLKYAGLGVAVTLSRSDVREPALVDTCLAAADRMVPLLEWLRDLSA